ncbi:MAG: hypothetical protein K9N49_08095 [Candidatus Marinimicrobia bacterium]|nr:hypothetical protein [Candidatus Neomarinimicrobiota bacterium]
MASASKPDFVVTAIALAPLPTAPAARFAAQVTVSNQGTAPGDAGLLRVFVSQTTRAAPGQPADAKQVVGWLPAGDTRTFAFEDLSAARTAGTHHFRAWIDAGDITRELSEGNNQASRVYAVPDPAAWIQPDFKIVGIVLDPEPLSPGDRFAAWITVQNQGDVPGDAGQLRIWRSCAQRADPSLTGDAEKAVGRLDANEYRTVLFEDLTAPENTGWHHFRAFVDADGRTLEKSEGNNQASRVYPLSGKALAIASGIMLDAIVLDPVPRVVGERFAARVRVSNQGAAPTEAGVLRIERSHQDPLLPGGAVGEQAQAVGALQPGESRTLVFDQLAAPATPGWHLFRGWLETTGPDAGAQSVHAPHSVPYSIAEVRLQAAPHSSGVLLEWNSKPGRSYRVLRSNDLRVGFQPVADVYATPPFNQLLLPHPPSGTLVFYMIEVE